MDQETKDYLDRKLLVLVKREDVEKLRQETKANFRQLKEENKTQLLEVNQEIKTDLERWLKEERQAMDSVRAEFKEKQPSLDQWNQGLVSSLKELREEIQSMFAHSKLEMGRNLQLIREEEATQRAHSREEWKAEINQLSRCQEELRKEMKRMADEASSLHGKIKEGLTEIKEELGAMMRFSFADLEKKMNTLDARIKALEKMVFH